MSQSDLARSTGLSQGAISKVILGYRQPGPDFCTAIAKAFEYSPEFVFRLAGLLPEEKQSPGERQEPPGVIELLEIFKNASAQEREEILEYVRWRELKAREESKQAQRRRHRPAEG